MCTKFNNEYWIYALYFQRTAIVHKCLKTFAGFFQTQTDSVLKNCILHFTWITYWYLRIRGFIFYFCVCDRFIGISKHPTEISHRTWKVTNYLKFPLRDIWNIFLDSQQFLYNQNNNNDIHGRRKLRIFHTFFSYFVSLDYTHGRKIAWTIVKWFICRVLFLSIGLF